MSAVTPCALAAKARTAADSHTGEDADGKECKVGLESSRCKVGLESSRCKDAGSRCLCGNDSLTA